MKMLLMYWSATKRYDDVVSLSRDAEALQRGIDRKKESDPSWFPEGEPIVVTVKYAGLTELVRLNDIVFLEPDEMDYIEFPQ